jgi:hypothetical protein
MLHGITLDGFRSFTDNTWVELAPLTVVAGQNNTGKSSVLGALAALVQSQELSSRAALLLQGDWVDLGRFDEVVSFRRTGAVRSFDVGVVGDGPSGVVDVAWHFEAAPGDQREVALCTSIEFRVGAATHRGSGTWPHPLECERLAGDGQSWEKAGHVEMLSPGSVRLFHKGASEDIPLLPVNAETFRYLGPYRAEPRDLYQGRVQAKGPPLGRDGRFVAEFLYRKRHHTTGLLPTASAPVLLGHALNEWWSFIFDLRLTARVNELERIGYTLKVDTPSAENLGLGMVGLGLSQSLPIVALVLGSSRSDVVAVETPEAHLHPAAQHRLALLLVAAVREGRQVIVETHSEHVVNAIRLAIKSRDLAPEQVALHFFEMDDNGSTVGTRINLDQAGRVDRWPAGFFDQAPLELAKLL